MADEHDDPRVSQRYRSLGDEQPPRELDQAILAAAHRASDAPHAPLVAPAGRHRWYFSLAAAAVLMLAVGIALHIDRQQPDPEAIPPARDAERSARLEAEAQAGAKRADEAKPAKGKRELPQRSASAQSREAPAQAVDDVAALQKRRDALQSAPAAAAPRAEPPAIPPAEARAMAKPAPSYMDMRADTPERELERIAELRRLGRDDDADKALADFRKRYPDYRLSQEMRSKVERARAR